VLVGAVSRRTPRSQQFRFVRWKVVEDLCQRVAEGGKPFRRLWSDRVVFGCGEVPAHGGFHVSEALVHRRQHVEEFIEVRRRDAHRGLPVEVGAERFEQRPLAREVAVQHRLRHTGLLGHRGHRDVQRVPGLDECGQRRDDPVSSEPPLLLPQRHRLLPRVNVGARGGSLSHGGCEHDALRTAARQLPARHGVRPVRRRPEHHALERRASRAELVTEEPIGPGTRFVTVNRDQEMQSTITRFDRPDRLELHVTGKAMDVDSTLTFRPSDSGTKLAMEFEPHPKGVMKILFPLLKPIIKRDLRTQHRKFAEFCEMQGRQPTSS
jgi:hypothetical protein